MGPKCNPKCPYKRERERFVTNGRREDNAKIMEKWCGYKPRNLSYHQTPKRQGTNSPLELPKGAWTNRDLHLGPVILLLDFWPPEGWEDKSVLF